MFKQDKDVAKDVADEHWYGVQDAANYLGIHRATLFRALRSGLIVADRTTPKGRARFRLETLAAFSDLLRHQAATNQDHVFAPVLMLSKLVGLVRSTAPVADGIAAIEETVRLLCSTGGNFDMACVALHVPCATDPYALKLLAERGFPERLKASYTYLRPYTQFPVNMVLLTGDPDICDDVTTHHIPHETARRVLTQSNVSSYAVYPIVAGNGIAKVTLGALVVCGYEPHRFSRQEQTFLAGVADALSACITQGSLHEGFDLDSDVHLLTPEMTFDIVSRLMNTAYLRTRCPDAIRSPLLSVEALCNLVVDESRALTTWTDGFSPEPCGNAIDEHEDEIRRQYRSNLQSLVQRTRAADGLKREQWQSRVTAVALPVSLPRGGYGAVGAVWPGVRTEVAAEGIVLSTLASACSLVTQYASSGCD